MKITVEVTEEDIKAGRPRDAGRCPIASALVRCVPGATYASVGKTGFGVHGDDHLFIVEDDLPEAARAFVLRFDNEQPVKPLAFAVDVPASAVRK